MEYKEYDSMAGRKLWDWFKIGIYNNGLTKYVVLYSRLHIQRLYVIPYAYSHHFTDAEILNDSDLHRVISSRRFGNLFAE